jgi:hypothetical protein
MAPRKSPQTNKFDNSGEIYFLFKISTQFIGEFCVSELNSLT